MPGGRDCVLEETEMGFSCEGSFQNSRFWGSRFWGRYLKGVLDEKTRREEMWEQREGGKNRFTSF